MTTLQDIREKHFLSRPALAYASGTSVSTITRMETLGSKTKRDTAIKVLVALSKLTGEKYTLENVEGISLYNVMKDRRNKPKTNLEQTQNNDSAA